MLKEKSENKAADVRVGEIFSASWGYNMTHYDFFEVVKVTKTGVRVRELSKHHVGGDSFRPIVTPVTEGEHRFHDRRGEPMFRRLKSGWNGEPGFSPGEYRGWATRWDGKPKREDHLD